jgi:hypothetical protein
MTIYEAADWREQFQGNLEPGTALDVDLHTSGPWDIAGLQLLVSLVRTGERQDIPVRFLLVPASCRDVARRSGFANWLKSYTGSEL